MMPTMGRSRCMRTTQPWLSLLVLLLPVDAASALSPSKLQFHPSAYRAASRTDAAATCEFAQNGMRLYPAVSGCSAPTTISLRSSRLVAADAEAASEAPSAIDIAESASQAIDTLVGMLDDGVSPPPSLITLKQAIEGGDSETIAKALYELLAEQTLDFDMNEERKLVKTTVDYSETDNVLVREKMLYVYTYGISMFKRGYISGDGLKEVVLEKVAARVKMDGPEFDKWLNMPAV